MIMVTLQTGGLVEQGGACAGHDMMRVMTSGSQRAADAVLDALSPNVCGRFGRATASTEKNRDDSFELRMENGGLHA